MECSICGTCRVPHEEHLECWYWGICPACEQVAYRQAAEENENLNKDLADARELVARASQVLSRMGDTIQALRRLA